MTAYTDTPQIPQDNIYFLWFCNWWDGPLSGFARWNGKEVYFNCVLDKTEGEEGEGDEDDTFTFVRHYAMHELTPHQAAHQFARHQEFVKYVGDHTECDNGTFKRKRNGKVRQKQEVWKQFYDKHKERKFNVSEQPIVGWFEW